ncbi:MAG: hypothetical protein KJO77_10800, partial [Bacteroidia bacterium]|nr:hypothetical protein [Bacteroidia bacterium]
MKHIFKPYSFLLYFVMSLLGFIIGMFIAKWTGAGENQMMAGGAIVLGYGVVGWFIGLITAIMTAYQMDRGEIINSNKFFGIILIAAIAFLVYQVKTNASSNDGSI